MTENKKYKIVFCKDKSGISTGEEFVVYPIEPEKAWAVFRAAQELENTVRDIQEWGLLSVEEIE